MFSHQTVPQGTSRMQGCFWSQQPTQEWFLDQRGWSGNLHPTTTDCMLHESVQWMRNSKRLMGTFAQTHPDEQNSLRVHDRKCSSSTAEVLVTIRQVTLNGFTATANGHDNVLKWRNFKNISLYSEQPLAIDGEHVCMQMATFNAANHRVRHTKGYSQYPIQSPLYSSNTCT